MGWFIDFYRIRFHKEPIRGLWKNWKQVWLICLNQTCFKFVSNLSPTGLWYFSSMSFSSRLYGTCNLDMETGNLEFLRRRCKVMWTLCFSLSYPCSLHLRWNFQDKKVSQNCTQNCIVVISLSFDISSHIVFLFHRRCFLQPSCNAILF